MASPPRLLSSYKSAAQADQVFWFDASMLYIRVTNCQPTGDCKPIPESLIMHFPPREIAVCMEVNGARIPPSEEVSLVLRRSSRVKNNSDPTDAADFMYVSTDNLRTSSALHFQILEQDSATLVVSGSLEKKLADSTRLVAKLREAQWIMVSNCEIGPDGCAFVKAKQELFKHGMGGSIPSIGTAMETCVVGRFMGEPMILTQTVPLFVKRRHSSTSFGTLNAIPEDNEVERPTHNIAVTMTMASLDFFDQAGEVPFFDMPRSNHVDSTHKALAGAADFDSKIQLVKFDSSSLYMTDTDQEETWYKRGISTGIKVGLGIGIGMCIGVGIGLGLIIRKFRTTTNSLNRITL